jgi:formylglycine-generating enzyme required for sulfatase activity
MKNTSKARAMRFCQLITAINVACAAGSVVVTVLVAAAPVVASGNDDTLAMLETFRQEFIPITPGKGHFPAQFSMGRGDGGTGTARPVHVVRFNYDFFIARYEVPQNLWTAVMGNNPSRWKGPRNSVEQFSYDEAALFCQGVTTLLRSAKLISADQIVRLPSEAEWEYCARAGTNTLYSCGDDAKQLDDYAWHNGNAAGNDPPVGAKKPNPWGLYDIHGYLWEWCTDPWHPTYEGAPGDGSAWNQDGDPDKRVVRGGSWKDAAAKLASTYRDGVARQTRDDAIGLRCVLTNSSLNNVEKSANPR